MGFLSRFEGKMEDTVEGMASGFGGSSLSPVQITKKAEKQMRREKIVGAGVQYAPTLYTVLVSEQDDARLFGYYPTLAGEVETYLMAKANEMGLSMDGQPLVRFLADPELKRGKFDVVAEMVAAPIIARLRNEEMQRYGLAPASAGPRAGAGAMPQVGQPGAMPGAVPGVVAGAGAAAAAGRSARPSVRGSRGYVPPQPAEEDDYFDDYTDEPPARAGAHAGYVDPYGGYGDVDDGYGGWDDDDYVDDPYPTPAGAPSPSPSPGAAGGVPAVPMPASSAAPASHAAEPSSAPSAIPEVYLYDEERDRAYQLTGAPERIGRESANDIVVPDINVSRVHAEIRREPSGAWTITDLGSTNGVQVNGRPVQTATLRDADMITVGTTELEFQLLA